MLGKETLPVIRHSLCDGNRVTILRNLNIKGLNVRAKEIKIMLYADDTNLRSKLCAVAARDAGMI